MSLRFLAAALCAEYEELKTFQYGAGGFTITAESQLVQEEGDGELPESQMIQYLYPEKALFGSGNNLVMEHSSISRIRIDSQLEPKRLTVFHMQLEVSRVEKVVFVLEGAIGNIVATKEVSRPNSV